MSVEFNVRVEGVMKSLNAKWSTMLPKMKQGMKYGMELFLGQIQREQLSVVDGKVAAHGGFGTDKRSTSFGLRTVSGSLKRSMAVKAWNVGYDYIVRMGIGGMNAPYAHIHQYGGTINHPGGQPYVTFPDAGGSWRFFPLSKDKVFTPAYRDSTNARVQFTRPHAIKIPKRLYIYEEFKETGRELIANAMISRALGFKRVGSFV